MLYNPGGKIGEEALCPPRHVRVSAVSTRSVEDEDPARSAQHGSERERHPKDPILIGLRRPADPPGMNAPAEQQARAWPGAWIRRRSLRSRSSAAGEGVVCADSVRRRETRGAPRRMALQGAYAAIPPACDARGDQRMDSTALRISGDMGSTLLSKRRTTFPSRSMRYLLKFQVGSPAARFSTWNIGCASRPLTRC